MHPFKAGGRRRPAFLASAILALPLMFAGSTYAAGGNAAQENMSVTVEVDGSVPGFSPDQLETFVSQQMEAADVTAWHFAPEKPGAAEPANRVVWHFKPLPYAGGTVRYIGPVVSKAKALFGVGRAVGIDAKIYLGGKYQATTFDQVTIKGGSDDAGLATTIQKLTRSIVANAMADAPADAPKVA
jgi:hypothetical protein